MVGDWTPRTRSSSLLETPGSPGVWDFGPHSRRFPVATLSACRLCLGLLASPRLSGLLGCVLAPFRLLKERIRQVQVNTIVLGAPPSHLPAEQILGCLRGAYPPWGRHGRSPSLHGAHGCRGELSGHSDATHLDAAGDGQSCVGGPSASKVMVQEPQGGGLSCDPESARGGRAQGGGPQEGECSVAWVLTGPASQLWQCLWTWSLGSLRWLFH